MNQGFKRTISWNKYISEITMQTKSDNLSYLIEPTFRNINRLFVILFKNSNDDPTRYSFDEYYMPLVEIKDFNALIDKKKQRRSVWKDYRTGSLLDWLYHQHHYKLIGVDLSRQTNSSIPQKINFVGKLEEYDGATMFLLLKRSRKQF